MATELDELTVLKPKLYLNGQKLENGLQLWLVYYVLCIKLKPDMNTV